MTAEVMEAINAASKKYAQLDDVQNKVGERIAALCHAEAATVTAGCWSALVIGIAGVLTGNDSEWQGNSARCHSTFADEQPSSANLPPDSELLR